MITLKLLPYKKTFLLICLLFFLLIYNQAFFHILFFDDSAADIVKVHGESVKFKFFYGLLSLNNGLFEYNFFQSFMFPLLMIVIGKAYHYLKNRYCRYYLGRTQSYYPTIKKLKIILSILSVFIFSLILVFIITVSKGVGKFDLSGIEYYFNNHSILSFFGTSTINYLIYYFLVKSFALLAESFLIFKMIDYFNNFTKSALVYLLFMWGTAPILYSFLPFYLVPMSHIMITSYGNVSLWMILASYLPICIFYAYLKRKNAYDIT
ncbi:hypothetical protein BOVMAS02_08570 [Streptococcus uberis]|uniref:Membrane protein n=1 Tax=Streptococcus uberis (strain ATCC BAA-854 / 0140J) TaxID=218495 RepID=B9DRG1_STRU0|nr:hypothetical protein [Streptococcus uberis]AUC24609.1 hypothetical protein CGZ53_02710 [Streptococcus uberis]KKF42574.1 membrane protein [Streptococcus uberis C9359]KKF43586.1 membrane protein [Streptococcus uberis EF20/0145]KKF44594.1 membrane protein [Streptococcus uberis Ab71]KKF46452.1 membrane protein [Streptococcus uberis C8329]